MRLTQKAICMTEYGRALGIGSGLQHDRPMVANVLRQGSNANVLYNDKHHN